MFLAFLPQSTRPNFSPDRMPTWTTPGSSCPIWRATFSPHEASDTEVDKVMAPVAGSAAFTAMSQREAARQAASKTAAYSSW